MKSKLKNLASYADSNPFTMDDLLDMYNNQHPMPGEMEKHVVVLPFGYRIVYSVETQNRGDFRHMSMSVDTDGKLPNIIAVKEVMKIIGFENPLEECIVKLEDITATRQAISVLELKAATNG